MNSIKKIILVTGASSKLGMPLVECLAAKGWIVYAGMRDTKKSPWKNKKNILPIKLDVTSEKEVKAVISTIVSKYKRIDCVVNNVGVSLAGPTLEFTSEQFLQLLDVNTLGVFRICKAIYPQMKKQKNGGKVINISSLNGLVSLPNFGLYSATKFALEALTSALRTELKSNKVWLTSIAPGAIKSLDSQVKHGLPHKPLREKFKILGIIFRMTTQEEVISKIVRAIESSRPPARIVVGRDVFLVSNLQRFLPLYMWDKISFFIWSR